MTDNAILILRKALSSKWRWLCSFWNLRLLVLELVDAYERSQANIHIANAKGEALKHELAELEGVFAKERNGNQALRKFIELNHQPQAFPPQTKTEIGTILKTK